MRAESGSKAGLSNIGDVWCVSASFLKEAFVNGLAQPCWHPGFWAFAFQLSAIFFLRSAASAYLTRGLLRCPKTAGQSLLSCTDVHATMVDEQRKQSTTGMDAT